jgi:hypothetical protein
VPASPCGPCRTSGVALVVSEETERSADLTVYDQNFHISVRTAMEWNFDPALEGATSAQNFGVNAGKGCT